MNPETRMAEVASAGQLEPSQNPLYVEAFGLKAIHPADRSSDVDDDIRIMQENPNLQDRLAAAQRIASEIDRPTLDQVRQIAGILTADRNAFMRCAAAEIFGAVATRPQYRRHARLQPELSEIISAMQRAVVYEQWPQAKVCLMNAAGQFDSKEIVPIIQAGKKDIDYNVRNAAQDAERVREQRLRDEGIRPNEK